MSTLRLEKCKSDGIGGSPSTLVLENFTPHRLNMLARFVSEGFVNSYAREAKEFGIGPAEWRVISFLGEHFDSLKGTKEMTARDIGARTFMQKVQVSRAILKLERKRLISRRLNFNDRREVFLRLTPSGKRVYATIVPIALNYQRALTNNLSAEDMKTLDRVMEVLLGNAKKLSPKT